jgi:hypothetical protein
LFSSTASFCATVLMTMLLFMNVGWGCEEVKRRGNVKTEVRRAAILEKDFN